MEKRKNEKAADGSTGLDGVNLEAGEAPPDYSKPASDGTDADGEKKRKSKEKKEDRIREAEREKEKGGGQ